MATPHIEAKIGDFADTILMPGDPLRAQYIANTFLTSTKEVNKVRGMLGYTGKYKGKDISVMGHGIGIPSCSIYIHELITHFGVKNIIRIGSCGAIKNDINIRDIIIAMGASTDSKVNRLRFHNNDFAAIADFNLLQKVVKSAKKANIKVIIGNIFSTDLFYTPDLKILDTLEKYDILGIEMESAGIYSIAAELKAHALTICTVSDHIKRKESLNATDRQVTFNVMIKLALESTLLN